MTLRFRRVSPTGALYGAFAAIAALYLYSYWHCKPRRHEADMAHGWWSWWDQSHYYKDVMAWAAGNLDPAQHFYFPGYALIGVPFAHITPLNPFAIPDFLAIMLTAWLLGRLVLRLVPDRTWIPAITIWVFFWALLLRPAAMRVWVEPWDTTPVVPLCLWALLAALRFGEAPEARRALVVGLAVGLISGFRPLEAGIYGAACAAYCLAWLVRLPRGNWVKPVMAGFIGLELGLAPGLVAYVATHGLRPSDYMIMSHNFGFEWRFLPFQWVTIMLSPGPVLLPRAALFLPYPWFFSGLAGFLAALLGARVRGSLPAYLLIGGASVANLLIMLCYRGLESVALFDSENQHYFKIVSVCLLVLTVALGDAMLRSARARRIGGVSLLLMGALLPWRVGFVPDSGRECIVQGNRVFLPQGMAGVGSAVLVKAQLVDVLYEMSGLVLKINGQVMRPRYDFQDVPAVGGVLVRPQRDLPSGPAEIDLPANMIPAQGHGVASLGWLRVHFAP